MSLNKEKVGSCLNDSEKEPPEAITGRINSREVEGSGACDYPWTEPDSS